MRTNRHLICLLLFLCLSVCASVVSAQGKTEAKTTVEWQRYNLAEGMISVLLPGKPEESSDDQTPSGGINIKSRSYTVNLEQGSFVVGHSKLSEQADKWSETAVEAFYSGVWEGISKTFDAELEKNEVPVKTNLLEKRRLKFSGYDGREIIFSVGTLKGRVMMTLVGHHGFIAVTVATEQALPDDRAKFFNSITINAPPVKQ